MFVSCVVVTWPLNTSEASVDYDLLLSSFIHFKPRSYSEAFHQCAGRVVKDL